MRNSRKGSSEDDICIKVKSGKSWEIFHDCTHSHNYVCQVDGHDCVNNPPQFENGFLVITETGNAGGNTGPCLINETCQNTEGKSLFNKNKLKW